MKGKPFSRCFDLFTGLRTSMTVAIAIWMALRAPHCGPIRSWDIYITYSTVARDLWRRKQTLSEGYNYYTIPCSSRSMNFIVSRIVINPRNLRYVGRGGGAI